MRYVIVVVVNSLNWSEVTTLPIFVRKLPNLKSNLTERERGYEHVRHHFKLNQKTGLLAYTDLLTWV